MLKLKKFMFIGSIILGVSLIATYYFYNKSEDIEIINNFVASKNKESLNNEDSSDKEHEDHGQVINVETKLAVRKEPNVSSSVDDTLYNGMTFDIIDKEEEWYEIQREETVGFVHEDYVEEYAEVPPIEEVTEAPIEEVEIETLSIDEENVQNKLGTPIKAELTAYCNDPRCSDGWGSQTAMQTETRLGVVAAPSNIPLGSKLYIPELENYKPDGIFNVEDRGGAVKQKEDGTYIIDVWLPTHEQVEEFGRKSVTIYLVE